MTGRIVMSATDGGQCSKEAKQCHVLSRPAVTVTQGVEHHIKDTKGPDSSPPPLSFFLLNYERGHYLKLGLQKFKIRTYFLIKCAYSVTGQSNNAKPTCR